MSQASPGLTSYTCNPVHRAGERASVTCSLHVLHLAAGGRTSNLPASSRTTEFCPLGEKCLPISVSAHLKPAWRHHQANV
ncbi:hypothetical protein EYF80_061847 [Liparis tanakae]|uniref:Uncharacterized protein n=1 Tax=Liparis tanakae TaxID=230148 RepID=A0A4Z2EGE4_9TELE|nr:hypothetical protein EYF80_061847 [Liparis tanakae]